MYLVRENKKDENILKYETKCMYVRNQRSDGHCTHLQSRVEPLPALLDADPLPLLAQLLPLRGVQLRLELGLHVLLAAATCG